MHTLSLKPLDSSSFYQTLLDRLISREQGGESGDMGAVSLADFVRQLVEYREQESSTATERRWFGELSMVADKVGALRLTKALEACMKAMGDNDLALQVQQVMRDVCMRHETVHKERPYDAHMMMVPLVFRGTRPSQFPCEIDSAIVGNLQFDLQKAFGHAIPRGEDALLVPGNVLYTLDEFQQERDDFFHGLLALVTKTCAEEKSLDRATWIKFPDAEHHGVRDSTLVDLSIPRLEDGEKNAVARNTGHGQVNTLPDGLWITVKLLPVVVFWPREDAHDRRSGPCLQGFGIDDQHIARWIAFCSPSRACRDGDAADFEVAPIGLFSPQTAARRARMVITYETFLSKIRKTLPDLDPYGLVVRFCYSTKTHLFDIVIQASNGSGGAQIYLPNDTTTQMYIEKMAAEVRALGVAVQVDLGDGMLRYECFQKSRVQ